MYPAINEPDESDDEHENVYAIRLRCVHFDEHPEQFDITPYGEIYGRRPGSFVFKKDSSMKALSDSADPFTGKSTRIMENRWAQYNRHHDLQLAHDKRQRIWNMNAHLGNAWEIGNSIYAVRTPQLEEALGKAQQARSEKD